MIKKIISCVLLVSIVLSMNIISAYSYEYDDSSLYTFESVDCYDFSDLFEQDDDIFSEKSINSIESNIDYILSHSTNVTRSGSEYWGDFTSDKYSAGILGYKYRIYFEWKLGTNSAGDYYFSEIKNVKVTTYTNHLILALSWGYYDYRITHFSHTLSSDKKSVTFNLNYEVSLSEKDSDYIFTRTLVNKQTYTAQEVI